MLVKAALCLYLVSSFAALPKEPASEVDRAKGFQWRPALEQAGLFLSIQHAFRFATEPGTRQQLKGPFWRDYLDSVRGLRGWGDGDPFLVNYIGHPFMGAVTGYIQVHNDPQYSRLEYSPSDLYWRSRLRALAFSAAFSTQFEVGPLSEASLGNVGRTPGTSGAVDLVVTPLAGMGVMVGEDVVDHYLVRRVERLTTNRVVRLLARGVLNPNRSFANLVRFKRPWHRDSRPGVSEF